jgi:hypothetical protein
MTKPNLYVVPQPRPPEVKNTLAGIVDALSLLPAWAGVLLRAEPPFGPGSLTGQAVHDRDVDQIRLCVRPACRPTSSENNQGACP